MRTCARPLLRTNTHIQTAFWLRKQGLLVFERMLGISRTAIELRHLETTRSPQLGSNCVGYMSQPLVALWYELAQDENECPACGRSRVVAEAATMAGCLPNLLFPSFQLLLQPLFRSNTPYTDKKTTDSRQDGQATEDALVHDRKFQACLSQYQRTMKLIGCRSTFRSIEDVTLDPTVGDLAGLLAVP
eukprot:6470028-Amphidinium_carterae.1